MFEESITNPGKLLPAHGQHLGKWRLTTILRLGDPWGMEI
jgi:hypothetical protein